MTNDERLQAVIRSLPYPDQIRELDTAIEDNAIRFKWRKKHYRVSGDLFVEEIDQQVGVLIGSDITIIMRRMFEVEKIHAWCNNINTELKP